MNLKVGFRPIILIIFYQMMSHICLNNYKHYLLQLFLFLNQLKILQEILKLMHLKIKFTLIRNKNPSYTLDLFYIQYHLRVFFSDNLSIYKMIRDNKRNYILFNLIYYSSSHEYTIFPIQLIVLDNLSLISISFHQFLTKFVS